jgi:Icc-related predicted phosphoesterase
LGGRQTRIFFVTDLHGSERAFNKFVNAISIYKANVAIIGGDLTGKLMIAITKTPDGKFSMRFLDQNHVASSESELAELQKRIRDSGYYSIIVSDEEKNKIDTNQKYADEIFSKLMQERLVSWIRILEQKLASAGVKVYMTGGNDDQFYVDEVLDSSSLVVNAEGRVITIDDSHEMISTGYGNITPWKCPRDIPEDQLEAKIVAMSENVKDTANCVYNIHVPPISTLLDECPKLDTTVYPPRPILGQMTQGGSTAVRKVIQKYQPLVSLHGHIHESRGADKLGKTVCLNPGSEYSEGILRGVLVNLEDHKLKSYQFVSG